MAVTRRSREWGLPRGVHILSNWVGSGVRYFKARAAIGLVPVGIVVFVFIYRVSPLVGIRSDTFPVRIYLTSEGQQLPNLFHGRVRNAQYSALQELPRPRAKCRVQQQSGPLGFLGFAQKLYAQVEPWCYEETWCAGSYWVNDFRECLPTFCEGRFNWGRTDYENGDRCRGIQQVGYSPCKPRDIFSSCDCAWRTCNSCSIEP